MATSSFYNDNLYRAYPFVAGQPCDFPTNRLVGIKVCCLCGSVFTSFPSVYLTAWNITGESYCLTFLCTDGTHSAEKSITIPLGMEFCDRFVSDSDHDIEITLIAGRFDSETTPFNSLHLQIEPICIVWLRHRGISEIRICNQARYRLETDSENSPLDYAPDSEWWNQPTDSVLILQDQPLIFSEGWNCNLTLSQIDTKISFTAQEGAGLGEVSEDIPRGYIMEKSSNAEGGENAEDEMLIETIPAPSLRFDGLPDNRLVVYSFCGAVGPDVAVQASETVLIRADQSLFTVFISVAQLGGDSC